MRFKNYALTAAAALSFLAVPSVSASSKVVLTNKNWVLVQSDPDKYKSDAVDIVGKIFEDPQYSNPATAYQVYLDPTNYAEPVIVGVRGTPKFKNGDYVHIKGILKGSFTGQNALGGTVVDPVILGTSVTAVSAMDVLVPTLAVSGPSKYLAQNKLTLRVDKVEYAAQETRVYIRAINQSGTNVSFSNFEATLVQGTHQLAQKDDFQMNYPTFPSPMASGVVATEILTFGPANLKGGPLTFRLSASSDDYTMNWNDFVFQISPPTPKH